MFGANEIVGQSYFKDAYGKLFITSMFMTLQGEGPFSGRPSFFVRLAKCNLACSFCDTFFDKGDWFTYSELDMAIDKRIQAFFGSEIPSWAQWTENQKRGIVLVITGGEPMLQAPLANFLVSARHQFVNTQIESNGIIVQDGLPESTTLVVSPKCHERDGKAISYLKPNPKMLERADCLKFVMSAEQDSPYCSIPNWAFHWRDTTSKPIYISPMNIYRRLPQKAKQLRAEKDEITLEERSTVDEVISFWEPGLLDMEKNQANHEYAAKYCVRNGFRFNVQIHLLASLA